MIKTQTDFTYPADRLTTSTTYRVLNQTNEHTQVHRGTTKTITNYAGNESDQNAQVTYNFNYDAHCINTKTV